MRSLPFLLTAALRNARTAWRELGKHRPDAIVVDSEYVAPLVAALGGIPIFSVNHARQSWSEWRRIRRSDRRGLVWNFYLLEGFEIVFYRLLSRAVLIPGISPELDGLAGPMCR